MELSFGFICVELVRSRFVLAIRWWPEATGIVRTRQSLARFCWANDFCFSPSLVARGHQALSEQGRAPPDFQTEIQPFSFNLSLLTFLLQPFSFNLSPSTFLLQPFTFNLSPSTFHFQPFSFNLSPSTFLLQPFTFNLSPSTAFSHFPSAFFAKPIFFTKGKWNSEGSLAYTSFWMPFCCSRAFSCSRR